MELVKIKVTSLDGKTYDLEGLEGWRVMEVIRDAELPIKAECGGCCACATCHIYVAESWVKKLIPASDEEIRALDDAFFVKENSRLSCQILLTKELEGLEVTIAEGGD
ncbi:MAG: 2Fe-2S iron-sulfur cluster-binding protein [Rickettsiales bacterium]|nr:2Fe-2S iron-sulfur cluster-binding protein [Rickettsiales bacterium]